MSTKSRPTFLPPPYTPAAAPASPTSVGEIFDALLQQNQRKIDIYLNGIRDVGAAADRGVADANRANPYGAYSALLAVDGIGKLTVALLPHTAAGRRAMEVSRRLVKISEKAKAIADKAEVFTEKVLPMVEAVGVALQEPDPFAAVLGVIKKALEVFSKNGKLAVALWDAMAAQEKARQTRTGADAFEFAKKSLALLQALVEAVQDDYGDLLKEQLKEQAKGMGEALGVLGGIERFIEAYEATQAHSGLVSGLQGQREATVARFRLRLDGLYAERQQLLEAAARSSFAAGPAGELR
jgi:hypothetical protein